MRILVVCGPSGVGKSTLIRALGRRLPGATAFAVSHTTRGPRGGEEDGVHYTFTSEASFAEMVERGEFVEHVCIHGARYGTSRSAIRRVAQGGRLPVLDVDLDGALNVDRAFPGSVCGVYVKPCSMSLLRQRLTARGTETEAQVHGRLSHAAAELERLEAEVDLQNVFRTQIPYHNFAQAWPLFEAALRSNFPSLWERYATDFDAAAFERELGRKA